jgi:cyclopropane-fatty-acyl-phospholipid synthase
MTATMERIDERRATRASLAILRTAFGRAFADDFAVALWDGTLVPARERERFRLVLTTPFALRAAFRAPLDLHPGEAFVERWLEVEGDLEYGIHRIESAMDAVRGVRLARIVALLARLPKPPAPVVAAAALPRAPAHTRVRDASAIEYHYDQPLAFYRAFLDERLVYSCAYYDREEATLDEAQVAKLDHIFRKLRLAPGERFLDIGCGWGALAIRAAQRFGAEALGVTLSRAQYDEARRRVAAAGLADRVRIELRDYRDLRGETFDKIASVGMVEHVGREKIDAYFATAFAALRPGGLFLNHGITKQFARGAGERVSGFVARYVFPDGDLLALETIVRAAERAGFETRDVENLREHYARTLRAWVANLARNRDAAIAATDERTYRVWRLYMTGSARGFARGKMGLVQTLFAKPTADGVAGVARTRRALYADDASERTFRVLPNDGALGTAERCEMIMGNP